MNLEAAERAVEAYGEPNEDFSWRVSDLVTDLLHIVAQRDGQTEVDHILRRVDRDLSAEPESPQDLRQFAMLAERDGLTSWAAKLYERADEWEQS